MQARLIALYYLAGSVAWIVMSDALLRALPDGNAQELGMVKGLLFVSLTGIALYLVLSRWDNRRQAMETALRDSNARLRESERNLSAIIDNLPDIFYRTDDQGHVLMMSRCGHEILGYDEGELIGRQLSDLYVEPLGREAFLEALLENGGSVSRYEIAVRRKDGQVIWLSVNARFARNAEGYVVGVEGLSRDVTEHRHMQDEMLRLSRFDPLTGLLNRTGFTERMEQALARARRAGGGLGVLFLDLDGFKEVNDGCGHAIGDLMLQEVASRLSKDLRETDAAGRFGGDEFLLLLEGTQRDEDFLAAAERLVNSLHLPFQLCGNQQQISVSIGLAQYPDDGNTAEELLRHADQAMYIAKSGGKNGFRCFQSNSASPINTVYASTGSGGRPNTSRPLR